MGETPLKPYGHVPLIQPDYTTIRHKWVGTIGLASSTGALEKFELRVNSPIDPNISTTTTTGTGATTNNTNTRRTNIYASIMTNGLNKVVTSN